MLIKCRASWDPVKLTWTQSVRKPPVKSGFILNALIYNAKDITFLHQYDNSCVWWYCAGLSVTNKLRPWKRNAMQKSQLSTWKSKKHLKKLLHRYSYGLKCLFLWCSLSFWCLFPPFHWHNLWPSQNADGSMQKVSVSKAKFDVPATNHSDKNAAEHPKGKPEVDSQSKKDAHIQTNELVVEKDEKGMRCLFKSSLWFLGGWLLARVPYSMQVRSLRRVIAKLSSTNHMILGFYAYSTSTACYWSYLKQFVHAYVLFFSIILSA